MESKRGKSGSTGRTLRSRFSQIRGKRSEGLLIHSSGVSSLSEESKNGGKVVTYSLGKQNRWLLPEAIKTSCGRFEEEDVVLVERYSNNSGSKHTRADCISVFNSKDGTCRKPRRKLARTKDLLPDDEELKARYEVTYPHPSGSWPKRSKRPAGHLRKRKKTSPTSILLLNDNDIDDLSETEKSDSEFEEDLSKQLDRSSRLDLSMLVNLSSASETHCGGICFSKSTKSSQHEQMKPAQTGRCFNVENDEEMQQKHVELLAQIKAGCSLLDASEHIKNSQAPAVQKRRCRQAKKRAGSAVADGKSTTESVPLVKTSCDPDEGFSPNRDDGIVLTLRQQEVVPETLAQQWHHMYKEGGSHPRTFALNLTSLVPFSNGKEVFLAFRVLEDHTRCHSSGVKAFVNMVVYNNNNGERTLHDFISKVKVKESDQKIWTIQDITDLAICFHSEMAENKNIKMDSKEPCKPRLSLDVFVELFGWRSKTYSSEAAKLQVKRCVTDVTGNPTASTNVPLDGNLLVMEFCEICFQEMQDKDNDVIFQFLSLIACGHKFCNSCWRAHLKTQIDLGQTELWCPGHECSAAVDDVTLLSLVPSLYGRYLTKRLDNFLESNPEWKWCPADQCKLVVKARVPQDSSKVCDAEHSGSAQPVPVACVCGNMWCFKCQEDAHWPATCEEARVFRQENASYAQLVTRKEKALVTNVQVKRCPSCYYPVEKGLGCNHMTCIFCRKEFCWFCLKNWSYHHSYEECRLVELQKIQLPTKFVNVVSYQHIAVTSRVARTSGQICRIHRKLDKIQEGLNIYRKCFPLKPDLKKTSCTEKQLNILCESNSIHVFKKVFNFKFQAHLALEGLAIRLSFSRGTVYSKRLAMEFTRLFFIVERMEELLRDLNHCLATKESLFKLKHFVKFGRKCILSIGRAASELR